jgi:two-component system, OmpR family, sensor histidine kinase VicK
MILDHLTDACLEVVTEIGNQSSDGVILYDLDRGKFLYVNSNAYKIIGVKEGSPLNTKKLLTLVVPEDRDYLANKTSNLRSQPVYDVEIRLIHESGTLVFICCTVFRLSKVNCLVVFIKDITKTREHEHYMINFGAKKNTILDTLVHQINGALHLGGHLTDEVQRSIAAGNEAGWKNYLELLRQNNFHCLQIISDLLMEEHQQSPSIFVKNSRVDIVEKVAVLYDELRRSHAQRRFRFEKSAESIFINTDPVKFLQIVNNFAANAIKFSPEHSEIIFRVQEADGDVVISVSDNGIGIPDNLKAYIFDRKGGSGRKGLNGEKSLGMGLPICLELVRLLSGKIWFESEEGRGSVFYVKLPRNGKSDFE